MGCLGGSFAIFWQRPGSQEEEFHDRMLKTERQGICFLENFQQYMMCVWYLRVWYPKMDGL